MESKSSKITSVKYHDIFDYKLTKKELFKWQYKTLKETTNGVKNKKQLQREKYSVEKLKIARKASKLISKIPTVKFIGITGALAMNNAGKNSDIDLMIITFQGTLWLTRFCVYCLLHTTYYILRKPRVKNERDALCLNMWLDENDLVWDEADRNAYTAHEIAQIVPLVNKDKIFEYFLYLNRWILNWWPNATKVIGNKDIKLIVPKKKNFITLLLYYFISILEKPSFKLQYLYMRSKMTREQVTPTRAIFHPNDWGKIVLQKLSS